MDAKRELERIIQEFVKKQHYNPDDLQFVVIEEDFGKLSDIILAKLPELGFVRIEDVEMEKEIAEMQEVADDKEASPEIRSNANSYIRGMKKAIAIASAKPIRVKEGK